MQNNQLKRICQHSRMVERLPRHFQSLVISLPDHMDVCSVQRVIRSILDSTQGRIFVNLNQNQNQNLYLAFEEPGDLVWVTLAAPALVSEKIL